MPVSLYFDVHVRKAILVQLRGLGVDVLTAREDGCARMPDPDLLERARVLNRPLFTQDQDFLVTAADWQRQNRPFAGVLFGPQLGGTIGQYVRDLELIAKASDPADWENRVQYLPFK